MDFADALARCATNEARGRSDEDDMKLAGKLFVALGVGATMALAHGDASADGKIEWASLVLGWEGDKVEWGMCVDKPTKAAADACAENRFPDNGGHPVEKQWSWTCHGGWAVAVSKTGHTAGKANCKSSRAEAQRLADAACEAAAGKGKCVPVRSGRDGDNL